MRTLEHPSVQKTKIGYYAKTKTSHKANLRWSMHHDAWCMDHNKFAQLAYFIFSCWMCLRMVVVMCKLNLNRITLVEEWRSAHFWSQRSIAHTVEYSVVSHQTQKQEALLCTFLKVIIKTESLYSFSAKMVFWWFYCGFLAVDVILGSFFVVFQICIFKTTKRLTKPIISNTTKGIWKDYQKPSTARKP